MEHAMLWDDAVHFTAACKGQAEQKDGKMPCAIAAAKTTVEMAMHHNGAQQLCTLWAGMKQPNMW
jgi:hypothetical protein